MRASCLSPLLLLAGTLPAQTTFVVSPAAWTTREGNSGNTFPFWNTRFSYMQIHDDLGGRPRLISEIRFRRDGTSSDSIAAFTANVTARLSNAAVTSRSASPVFAANHGGDLTEVLTGVNLNFPASTGPTNPPPAPFQYGIPFPTKAFMFKDAGSLAWELRIHFTSATGMNTMDGCMSSSAPSSRFGSGCRSSDQTSAATASATLLLNALRPGAATLYAQAGKLGRSQPCAWMVGVDRTRFGGIPLPLSLTPLGATGCSLYLAPLLFQAGIADASGNLSTYATPLPIPLDPMFSGLPVYSQFFGADPGNPAFPLVFTDCAEARIPALEPVCRIYTIGDDAPSTAATVDYTYVLVTRFDHQ